MAQLPPPPHWWRFGPDGTAIRRESDDATMGEIARRPAEGKRPLTFVWTIPGHDPRIARSFREAVREIVAHWEYVAPKATRHRPIPPELAPLRFAPPPRSGKVREFHFLPPPARRSIAR